MQSTIESDISRARATGNAPAFSYERVSTVEQTLRGLSLEYQQENAQAYAGRMGLEIVKSYTVAESAGKAGRKVFNEMISAALDLGVKHLIFKSTDRMSRNYRDLSLILDLIESDGINIHLYQQNKRINKNSTHDEKFLIGIEQAVAKHMYDKASYDMRQVYKFKAAQGIPPSRFPMGYKYDKEKRCHYKDPDKEELLRFIFDTFDKGDIGLIGLAALLDDKGYKTPTGRGWRKGYLEVILKNPIYAGFFYYDGIEYQAKHEPYFSKERYYSRLRLMADRRVSERKRDFEYALSGILRSGITGRVLTGHMVKDKYVYYTHRKPEVCFKEEKVFGFIDEYISGLRFNDNYSTRLKELFKQSINAKLKDAATAKASITRQITALEAKQAKIMDLYAEDDIDREAVKRKLRDIRLEIDRLLDSQKRVNLDKEKVFIDVATCIDNLKDLPYLYKQMDIFEKGELLKSMAKKINVFDDHVEFEWHPYYSEIIDGGLLPEKVCKSNRMRARMDDLQTSVDRVVDSILAAA